MTTQISCLLMVALVACASPRHDVRFANAPAVRTVADRSDVATAPAPRDFAKLLYQLRGHVSRPLMRALELPQARRSLGVNALDEVPDSTWFTNRIGVRELSLDEVRRGPTVVGSPEPHLPWTIAGTKVGGASIGFIIRDARGEKYVLKFDEPGFPELETATDVIVSRLLWAIGYNVPEDHVVYFRAHDLVLPPDARVKDPFGNTRPLRRSELDALLGKISKGHDGRIRGMASHLLAGTWLGGHPDEGVRRDDPNDRIPHERRRELRGARAIFAWLDHVDVKEDNTLDMWVEDPAHPHRHFVRHYLIDFGKSLGTMASSTHDPRPSYAYAVDPAGAARSLVTLGLADRPWDTRATPAITGIGMYASAGFSPATWRPYTPSYLPLLVADDLDGAWGARLVMRFTRAQLRAAVETGRLSDPRAVEYLTDTLVERQRISGRYWFGRVAPLDRFAVESTALCFDDLQLTYGLSAVAGITRYEVTIRDRAHRRIGGALGGAALRPAPGGRTCTAPIALAAGGDGYTIVEIRTRRHTFDATTHVHLARRDGATHIIGIWRTPASLP